MANLDKFKEQARKFEQKEQWSKAVEVYLKAIEAMEKSPEDDTDLSLYNKIGDLYQKAGDTQNAVVFYERAADKYAEGGFPNNAIALCNKILRLSPGRAQIYLKIGTLFAAKGLLAEAKQNLIEYADRMQKAGQIEEAFKALKAFAEMTPGQDDIWAVLAAQARATAKTDEQKEQVEKLLGEFENKDRVVQRKSRMSRSMITGEELPPETHSKKDLVFLDLGEPAPSPRKSGARPAPVIEAPPAPPQLEIESTALSGGDEPAPVGSSLGLEPTSFGGAPPSAEGMDLGLEPTSFGADTAGVEPPPADAQAAEPEFLDLDVGELEPAAAASPAEAMEGLPLLGVDETPEAAATDGLPMLETEALAEDAAPSLEFLDLGDVTAEVPTVASLEARIAERPDDWESHRRLGEVLLEDGKRERGLAELNQALDGLDQSGALELAFAVTEEILRLDPNSVRHQQKRVELAYRLNDRSRLVDAYNELGDALLRSNEPDKAVAVYQRVLEHEPNNARAQSAIDTLAPPSARPSAALPGLRPSAAAPAPRPSAAASAPAAPEPPAAAPAGDFIDLGAYLFDDEGPKDTRMRVEEEQPTGDEDQDFQSMLQAFKKGIAANVGEEDFQSHYDLGVAYKEMGLLDEAIAEFQKALRSVEGRLKASEALGACFFEKGQFAVAETILRRGVETPGGGDGERMGLLYWLGRSTEELGKVPDALEAYNRVFAVDINFQDVSQRVKALLGRRG